MSTQPCSAPLSVPPRFCRQLRDAISRGKERLQEKYADLLLTNAPAVHRALEQAEELAWETSFPQLFLPDFADGQLSALAAQPAFAEAA